MIEHTADTNGFRDILRGVCSRTDFPKNQQNVHTPFDLCYDIIKRLVDNTELNDKIILVLNLEFVEILCYDFNVKKEKIWFISDCPEKIKVLNHPRYKGVKSLEANYLLVQCKNGMKFDIIVGNPPYQTKSDADNTKTQAIWPDFVKKSFELLKPNGFLCMVHPSGWRNVSGMFEDTKELLLSKDIKYLEMHDKEQGFKTFGARTMYDWYIAQNKSSSGKTTIKSQDGKTIETNISKLPFIPNGMFDEIFSLLAKDGEEKVNVARDASNFHTQKEWMSDTKKGEFKYPCVYMVRVNDEAALWYSSIKNKGHFGIPKFIWGNGGYEMGSIIDDTGEYGLTQFAYAIIDKKENLPLIKKAFDSEKFKELMKSCDGGDSNINRKVIALFRKDFWKSFL